MSSSSTNSTASTSSRTSKASKLSSGNMSSLEVRKRAVSIASSVGGAGAYGCPECRDKRQDDLGLKINTDALVELASKLRNGVVARLGKKSSAALYYLVEITFEDGVSWLARIPKPWRSSHTNAVMYSEVSAFRYLKKHTRIPVPEVYHFANDTDSDNTVGVSFMLIEKMAGHKVPELQGEGEDIVQKATRFHEQLADIVLELASCKFDKIGSIQQSTTNPDEFTVGPLYTMNNTYPLARGGLTQNRGPYATSSEYFGAFTELNYRDAKIHYRSSNSDYITPVDEEIARFYLLNKMIPKFTTETGSNEGPFVFQNWGLTSSNILVDENCNITGLIEISPVIGPMPSLCRYPDIIYETSKNGLLFDRKSYQYAFLDREVPSYIPEGSCALESKEVRGEYLATAHKTWQFENSILYPAHKHLNLRGKGGLYEYAFGDTKFSEKTAFKELGDTCTEFQSLCPKSDLPHGKYSWDMPQRKPKRSRTNSSAKSRNSVKQVWDKAPWVRSKKEETWVREYVRLHRHLPPQVKAYDGRRRSNGPEKAFYMAWAFIRCRDASYMKRKNEKRRKTVKIKRTTGRMGSVRDKGRRVRGWSVGNDIRKTTTNPSMRSQPPKKTSIPQKSWKKFMSIFGVVAD